MTFYVNYFHLQLIIFIWITFFARMNVFCKKIIVLFKNMYYFILCFVVSYGKLMKSVYLLFVTTYKIFFQLFGWNRYTNKVLRSKKHNMIPKRIYLYLFRTIFLLRNNSVCRNLILEYMEWIFKTLYFL